MAEKTNIFKFKSSGITAKEQDEAFSKDSSNTPIGIATPVRESKGSDSLFHMNKSLALQIKDNFRNMLSTNHGERLMLGDFGANLKPLAYEIGTDDGDSAAISRITATTSKYMPFITLTTFEPIREVSPEGTLVKSGVRVKYGVPNLGVKDQTIEVIILSAG